MIIKNVKIVLSDKVIENGWIEIENDVIKSINSGVCHEEGIDGENKILMPGFIDCHTHGGYGVDFENSSVENYMKFSKMLTQEGITSYIHSSVTNSLENNKKYLQTFNEFKEKDNEYAKCLGVHLEGPFICKEKKGAHELALLENPNVATMKELNNVAHNNIAMVTYAPELDNGDFVKYLLENNIVPAAGHSNCDYPVFDKDVALGVKHITHLFNGMSGIAHQKPGLALAAMDAKNVLCEVITDGIHIDRQVLKLIYRLIGFERIAIITDSMIAKGMPDGNYKLGNLDVIKVGMKATLTDGATLAGSAANFNHNVKVMYETIDNLTLNQLIHMTSINAAKQFNIFDKTGSIEVNKYADLVLVDNDMNVYKTFVNGKCVYEQ
ncbi:N-acetylglucosamine-6-phosphate deacetylase [Spiroplasma culicicola]|uniref:N-acetylglucosamine-6-phosphate deacetylase n=1 Tax=Spiroplasma culicicola AES-1 TaxID=1276246 RepID=W6AGP8_9MOLU|nr:N-acetylglucosamine-6-phosphate deacetylase [Spiroplasma culicicola]AHI52859.1 N-acetylglucosamine-6-phosphate deacetylase [Spiroplasma culicicola AES-1]